MFLCLLSLLDSFQGLQTCLRTWQNVGCFPDETDPSSRVFEKLFFADDSNIDWENYDSYLHRSVPNRRGGSSYTLYQCLEIGEEGYSTGIWVGSSADSMKPGPWRDKDVILLPCLSKRKCFNFLPYSRLDQAVPYSKQYKQYLSFHFHAFHWRYTKSAKKGEDLRWPPRFLDTKWWNCLTLSLPRAISFKFPLYPHQKSYITQYGELGFSHSLLRWTIIILPILTNSLIHFLRKG